MPWKARYTRKDLRIYVPRYQIEAAVKTTEDDSYSLTVDAEGKISASIYVLVRDEEGNALDNVDHKAFHIYRIDLGDPVEVKFGGFGMAFGQVNPQIPRYPYQFKGNYILMFEDKPRLHERQKRGLHAACYMVTVDPRGWQSKDAADKVGRSFVTVPFYLP